eukprot:g2744.t1
MRTHFKTTAGRSRAWSASGARRSNGAWRRCAAPRRSASRSKPHLGSGIHRGKQGLSPREPPVRLRARARRRRRAEVVEARRRSGKMPSSSMYGRVTYMYEPNCK